MSSDSLAMWGTIDDKFIRPYWGNKNISSGWNPGHLPGLSAIYVKIPNDIREEFLVLCLEFYLASSRSMQRCFPSLCQLFSNDVDAVRAEIDRLD